MGRSRKESDTKSQLVSEICSISTRYVACIHRHVARNRVKAHFIDWYLILGVNHEAGADIIRKRYHKIALQVHPDKNNHPRAEFAFKLVSEAYACLSDKAKRKEFDSERCKNFCSQCNRIPCTQKSSLGESKIASNHKASSNSTRKTSSFKLWKGLKDIRERFREETRVIENCLRTNGKEFPMSTPTSCFLGSSNSLHRIERETPIFNPTDYVFQGYPHLRAQVCKRSDDRFSTLLQSGRVGTYDSPIFKVGSGRRMFSPKSACVSS